MPFNLRDFDSIKIEKPPAAEVIFNKGEVITDLPPKLKSQLRSTDTKTHDGDFSRQDSAIITALLKHGLTPDDTYATFADSARGQYAFERKNGHGEDYLQRTIAKAVGYLNSTHVDVDFSKKRPVRKGDGIITQKASTVEVEYARWVWPRYIPSGKITIIAGDPGLGKSTIALDILSRVSKGTFLPIGGRTIAGTSLIASAEDAAEDTIVPRLVACNADLSRIQIMREVKIDDETKYLSFPRDISRLRETIIKLGARLAVIDPFNAFLARDTDSHRDQDVRLVLAPFENIAEETGAAIIIIAHLNKREEASTMYRVGGSIGLVGAARSVLGVCAVPNKTHRILYPIKSNLSKTPMAVSYEVRGFTRQRTDSEWKGEERVKSSNIKWLGEVEFDPRTQSTSTKVRAEEAGEEFLKQMLIDGEVLADTVLKEGRLAGVSRPQIFRAKDGIGVKSIKKGKEWYWKLAD